MNKTQDKGLAVSFFYYYIILHLMELEITELFDKSQ